MAEDENSQPSALSKRFDEWAFEQSFSLEPVGWRVFMAHAQPDAMSPSSVELRCHWNKGWGLYNRDVIVGGRNEKLSELPITVSVYRAPPEWVMENIEKQGCTADEEGNYQPRPSVGKFSYTGPINTDDGVVNDKRGHVNTWLAFGDENYQTLLEMLIRGDAAPKFVFGITVRFDSKPKGDFEDRIWSGENAGDVMDGKIVLIHGKTNENDDVLDEKTKVETFDDGPSFEVITTLDRHKILLTAIQKLMLPLWIIAGAVFASLIWHH